MRAKPVSRGRRAAPRYERVKADDTARMAAYRERLAAGARSEAARFFHDLRQHLRLARVAVANQIGTEPPVIEALETGDVGRLPPWPETARVVTAYTAMVQMDPRPALHALHVAYQHHQAMAAERGLAGRISDAWRSGSLAERLVKTGRVIKLTSLKWAAALALPAVLVASLMLASGPQAASGTLASILGGTRGMETAAVRRDGFTWIEVADPRSRRGDKLQQSRR